MNLDIILGNIRLGIIQRMKFTNEYSVLEDFGNCQIEKGVKELHDRFKYTPPFLKSLMDERYKTDEKYREKHYHKNLLKAQVEIENVISTLYDETPTTELSEPVEYFISKLDNFYNQNGLTVKLIMLKELIEVAKPEQLPLLVNELRSVVQYLNEYTLRLNLTDSKKYYNKVNLGMEHKIFEAILNAIQMNETNPIRDKERVLKYLKFHVNSLLESVGY